MGKIKHARTSFHAPAPKPNDASMDVGSSTTDSQEQHGTEIPQYSGISIFRNIEIPTISLKQQLPPDFDLRSVISSKSISKQMTKKEKRELRHQTLRQKLEAHKVAQEKLKAKEKRKQTPIVGDMQLLSDALPTLDYLFKETKSMQLKEKPRPIKKMKQKTKAMLQEIELFQQIQKSEQYTSDPFGTISNHIKSQLEAKRL